MDVLCILELFKNRIAASRCQVEHDEDEVYLWDSIDKAIQDVKNLKYKGFQALHCPACQGKGCPLCSGSGFVFGKEIFIQGPEKCETCSSYKGEDHYSSCPWGIPNGFCHHHKKKEQNEMDS